MYSCQFFCQNVNFLPDSLLVSWIETVKIVRMQIFYKVIAMTRISSPLRSPMDLWINDGFLSVLLSGRKLTSRFMPISRIPDKMKPSSKSLLLPEAPVLFEVQWMYGMMMDSCARTRNCLQTHYLLQNLQLERLSEC